MIKDGITKERGKRKWNKIECRETKVHKIFSPEGISNGGRD